MPLFSRFFGKPAVPDPNQPLASAKSSPDALRIKAATHPGEEEQVSAVLELSDGETLRRLAGLLEAASSAVPSAVEKAARLRLAGFVDDGTLGLADLAVAPANPAPWLAIAALCRDGSQLSDAIASIPGEATRASLVLSSASSRVRQLAAQSITTPGLLHTLIKDVRNKDKSVYRILKQKTDALLAESRAAAERAGAAVAVCQQFEQHSRRAVDVSYIATYEQLESRWQALTLDSRVDVVELATRVTQAAAECRRAIQAQRQEAAEQAAEEAVKALARSAAEQAAAAAQTLADRASAAAAEEARRAQQAAESSKAAEIAAQEARRDATQAIIREADALIRKAQEALADGATQRAAGLRRTIDEKLSALPAVPSSLARQLQQLDAQLRELKQWKNFAVAPKRADLIAAMESLVGSSEAPNVLAPRIRDLQHEWRTTDKGIGTHLSGDRERFQRASQAAYEPCREWFEKQSQERQANLAQRQTIVARLQAFDETVSGATVEWHVVAQVLREAPQEWRRHFPVDREAGRRIQEEFDTALRRLQSKLDTWHEGNAADKQKLVGRARHLLTLSDHREAIDSVKALQSAWKATGPAPRDQERVLWTDFRQACDAVFQKSDKVWADHQASVEMQRLNAQRLCEEAERVVADLALAPSVAVTKVEELSTAFDDLPELPKGVAQDLAGRFSRALEACKTRVSRQRAQQKEQSVMDLLEAHRRINAFAWGAVGGLDDAERAALSAAIRSFIATVAHWPATGSQLIQQALAKAERRDAPDAALHEDLLRSLCVRGEILSELTTLPEDESLRRQIQVQRLMKTMGQGDTADHSDWEALIHEWVGVGAVAPDVYDPMQKRFMRAWIERPVRAAIAIYPPAPGGRTDARTGMRHKLSSDRGEGRPRKRR